MLVDVIFNGCLVVSRVVVAACHLLAIGDSSRGGGGGGKLKNPKKIGKA